MSSSETARQKYKKAVRLIDQASALLSEACGELCPLVGAIEQWEECGKAYDDIRALARRIAYSSVRDIVDLDSDAKASQASSLLNR